MCVSPRVHVRVSAVRTRTRACMHAYIPAEVELFLGEPVFLHVAAVGDELGDPARHIAFDFVQDDLWAGGGTGTAQESRQGGRCL